MTKCVFCGETIDKNMLVRLSRAYCRRQNIRQRLRLGHFSVFAHHSCVIGLTDLDESTFSNWCRVSILAAQAERMELGESLRRIESALLELPSDMVPAFIEEMARLGRMYSDVGEDENPGLIGAF